MSSRVLARARAAEEAKRAETAASSSDGDDAPVAAPRNVFSAFSQLLDDGEAAGEDSDNEEREAPVQPVGADAGVSNKKKKKARDKRASWCDASEA